MNHISLLWAVMHRTKAAKADILWLTNNWVQNVGTWCWKELACIAFGIGQLYRPPNAIKFRSPAYHINRWPFAPYRVLAMTSKLDIFCFVAPNRVVRKQWEFLHLLSRPLHCWAIKQPLAVRSPLLLLYRHGLRGNWVASTVNLQSKNVGSTAKFRAWSTYPADEHFLHDSMRSWDVSPTCAKEQSCLILACRWLEKIALHGPKNHTKTYKSLQHRLLSLYKYLDSTRICESIALEQWRRVLCQIWIL